MKKKRIIRQQLPIDIYEIVDTFSLGEDDYSVCDNCGKVIKNIAVVKNSKGKLFNVGMDCAETLSGITEDDIFFWNSDFKQAKGIRARINKYKKQGAIIKVQNTYYDVEHIEVMILKTEDPEVLGDYYWRQDISEEYLKKYLPELYKIAMVNRDFVKVDNNSFALNQGNTYDGYTFKYELKQDDDYPFKYAYAEIYRNGKLLRTGSNGGRDIDSCLTECARLYNKEKFNAGLRPLA